MQIQPMSAQLVALLIITFARLITAVRAIWQGAAPLPEKMP